MPQPLRQGFSLIELLVTLAVLTILISSAMPALAEFIERQRASAYVRQFSQHLAYARVAAYAVRPGTVYFINVGAGGIAATGIGDDELEPLQIFVDAVIDDHLADEQAA